MRSEPRTARWLPFVTFLAGVILTASAVVVLDQARGQEQTPGVPRQQDADAPDSGEVVTLFNSFETRKDDLPPIEGVEDRFSPEENARERFELADKALQMESERFLHPPRNTFDSRDRTGPLLEWSRRRIDAYLDMVDTDEERIRALRSEIAHVRTLLPFLKGITRGAASMITDSNVLEFDQYRLELESRLGELTQGAG